MLLAGLKITGQALISGSLFSYVSLFSLGGTGVSALLMYALRRGLGKERISFIGLSVAGALASNGVQLVLARHFVFGESVRYAASPVLSMGVVTGTLLGVSAEYFSRRSRWYAQVSGSGMYPAGEIPANEIFTVPGKAEPLPKHSGFDRFRKAREALCLRIFSSGETAAAGLCMAPALLLNPDTKTRIIQFVFFWILAWAAGKKNNPFITATLILGIVFFNVLVPYGELLFDVGPLKITAGALWAGIHRAVTLEGLIMLSRCCVRRDLALPGFFGKITGEALRIFSSLSEERLSFNRRNWVQRLDDLLLSLGSYPKAPIKPERVKNPSRLNSRIILFAAIILAWLPIIRVCL
jgi:heptaprenyl diphosphate synthase